MKTLTLLFLIPFAAMAYDRPLNQSLDLATAKESPSSLSFYRGESLAYVLTPTAGGLPLNVSTGAACEWIIANSPAVTSGVLDVTGAVATNGVCTFRAGTTQTLMAATVGAQNPYWSFVRITDAGEQVCASWTPLTVLASPTAGMTYPAISFQEPLWIAARPYLLWSTNCDGTSIVFSNGVLSAISAPAPDAQARARITVLESGTQTWNAAGTWTASNFCTLAAAQALTNGYAGTQYVAAAITAATGALSGGVSAAITNGYASTGYVAGAVATGTAGLARASSLPGSYVTSVNGQTGAVTVAGSSSQDFSTNASYLVTSNLAAGAVQAVMFNVPDSNTVIVSDGGAMSWLGATGVYHRINSTTYAMTNGTDPYTLSDGATLTIQWEIILTGSVHMYLEYWPLTLPTNLVAEAGYSGLAHIAYGVKTVTNAAPKPDGTMLFFGEFSGVGSNLTGVTAANWTGSTDAVTWAAWQSTSGKVDVGAANLTGVSNQVVSLTGRAVTNPATGLAAGLATGTPIYVSATLAGLGGVTNTAAGVAAAGGVTGTPWTAQGYQTGAGVTGTVNGLIIASNLVTSGQASNIISGYGYLTNDSWQDQNVLSIVNGTCTLSRAATASPGILAPTGAAVVVVAPTLSDFPTNGRALFDFTLDLTACSGSVAWPSNLWDYTSTTNPSVSSITTGKAFTIIAEKSPRLTRFVFSASPAQVVP